MSNVLSSKLKQTVKNGETSVCGKLVYSAISKDQRRGDDADDPFTLAPTSSQVSQRTKETGSRLTTHVFEVRKSHVDLPPSNDTAFCDDRQKW